MDDLDLARSSPGPLATSLDESLGSASWLTPSDRAAVSLAVGLAKLLDEVLSAGESVRDVPQLSARYLSVLQQLHLTVDTRVTAKQGDETDGQNYVGDYLRLINTEAEKPKSRSANSGASGRKFG